MLLKPWVDGSWALTCPLPFVLVLRGKSLGRVGLSDGMVT